MNSPVRIDIDPGSGFCFGVTGAVRRAEQELGNRPSGTLYCLGEIVHNSDEVQRLQQSGLVTITHAEMEQLHDVAVLLRAHGEPPSTYELARRNRIELIDATCPVVLKLQQRIKQTYRDSGDKTSIVIYGRPGHAEVNGLVGQTDGKAIVVQNIDDLANLDFSHDICLYSQTTKSPEGMAEIIEHIERRMQPGATFTHYDTICRQVSGRFASLRDFAATHHTVIFVSGTQSSNGRVLHAECLKVNPNTYNIARADQLQQQWLENSPSIGICGATSTPRRLLEQVARQCSLMTGGVITSLNSDSDA